MILLVSGLVLWSAAHFFKRFAPGVRAGMGNAGKGAVAVAILASVGMMIWGYQNADSVPVYAPLPGMGHANNTLMLIAVYLYGVGHAKGLLSAKLRHPMLLGTMTWAVAHLLVNGDLASILLFGGILIWAFAEIRVINATAGAWVPPQRVSLRGDLINIAVTLVVYGLVAGIHIWLGYNPFLGTYP